MCRADYKVIAAGPPSAAARTAPVCNLPILALISCMIVASSVMVSKRVLGDGLLEYFLISPLLQPFGGQLK
jgi:hypothetical protein